MTEMYQVIRNYNKNTLTWDDAIQNYNESVLNKKIIKFTVPGFFVCHEGHKIDKVKSILKELNCNTAHLYFSITTEAPTIGRHDDGVDVFFWQCIGETKWIIDDKYEEILKPGDIINIRRDVWHEVIPLSPRLGVSMAKD